MTLDFQGLPLDVNDKVIFADYFDGCLRTGTITSIGSVYVSILADVLWTTFRALPQDVVRVNTLSLPEFN